jgi:dynactin 6
LNPLTHRSTLAIFLGVECPSIGDGNTISTKARIHHTVRLGSYCVVGAGCLVVPTEDEVVDDYTSIFSTSPLGADGPALVQRHAWSGRGQVQEADLRRKHAEYLREMLPKFNRLRRGDTT